MAENQEPTLAQVLAALQATNGTINSLKQMVEKQAETIAELKSPSSSQSSVAAQSEPTMTENERRLQDQLNKLTDANNKFYSEQRKEKLYKAVQEGLLARGADPKKLDIALAYIKDKVSIDKAGNMKMVSSDGIENTLEVELDKFCDSEQGGFFKPAVPIQGAGITPFRSSATPSSNTIRAPQNPTDVMPEKDFSNWIVNALGVR